MGLKLSIITINYNNAEGLKETIKSVISQKWDNFEYIIIDGNSTDKSVCIIENYQTSIDYWVSEVDKGIYNAMNKGIVRAKGEYLLFLNSGDLLNGVTALQNFINHPNFKGDIIYGDYKFLYGEKIFPNHLTPLFFIKSSLPHQSTFLRRKVFDELGLYDESYKISSDREFFIRCFLSNKFKFNHVKYSLTIFDLCGLSNLKEYHSLKKQEDETILKKQIGLYYQDYKHYLELEQKLSLLKRSTIKGVLKRIKNRLKI